MLGDHGGRRSRRRRPSAATRLLQRRLTAEQIADIYAARRARKCGPRLLVLGSLALRGAALDAGGGGLAYGLLQADMVDEFLLHYFATSAHAHARHAHGARIVRRDRPRHAGDGLHGRRRVLAPTYLVDACFEEPGTRARENAAAAAAVARRRSSLRPHDAWPGEPHDRLKSARAATTVAPV